VSLPLRFCTLLLSPAPTSNALIFASAAVVTNLAPATPLPQCASCISHRFFYALFLGVFGADRFYYGYWAIGAAKCLVGSILVGLSCFMGVHSRGRQAQKESGLIYYVAAMVVLGLGVLAWIVYDAYVVATGNLLPADFKECCVSI
jgi:hypothetical protein